MKDNKQVLEELKVEQDDLEKKIRMLNDFLYGEYSVEHYMHVGRTHYGFLETQLHTMQAYADVLKLRIDDLDKENDNDNEENH